MTLALCVIGGYMATMLLVGCWNELRSKRTVFSPHRPRPVVRYRQVRRIARGFVVVR